MYRLKAEAGLGRHQPVGDTPGFARAIAAVIAELRLGSVTSGEISKVAPDLMRLMEAYEVGLAEAELTDWPDVLNLATETASGQGGAHRVTNLPMLLLDLSIRSEAKLAFLRAHGGFTAFQPTGTGGKAALGLSPHDRLVFGEGRDKRRPCRGDLIVF